MKGDYFAVILYRLYQQSSDKVYNSYIVMNCNKVLVRRSHVMNLYEVHEAAILRFVRFNKNTRCCRTIKTKRYSETLKFQCIREVTDFMWVSLSLYTSNYNSYLFCQQMPLLLLLCLVFHCC